MDRVREFFQNLDNIASSFSTLTQSYHYPYDTTPHEFLEQAEHDLESKLSHAFSNSLSNTKRALDSQLDYFFYAYGLSTLSEKNRWSTGKKIRVVGDLGIVPSRILHTVNQARNDLEHKFQQPSETTATNALDVVGLFVAALDMYLYPVFNGVEFEYREGNKKVELFWDDDDGTIHVSGSTSADVLQFSSLGRENYSFNVDPIAATRDYFFLLTLLLHFRRFFMRQCSSFFKRLKYIRDDTSNFWEN